MAAAAGLVVVGSALTSAFIWPGFAQPPPVHVLALTGGMTPVQPAPPFVAAQRVADQSVLAKSLPDYVSGYVQTSISGIAGWSGGDSAIESWRFTYADGQHATAQTIVLDIGQWATPEAAEQFLAARLAPLERPIAEGKVKVEGTETGRYALILDPTGGPQSDQGMLYWRNGTVVFRATGRIDRLKSFYQHFPI